MGNPVVHFEFWSKDPAKTSEFYEQAFAWRIQHVPEMSYWMADTEGPEGNKGVNGGIFRPEGEPEDWPGKVAIYIQVLNLEAALERVVAAGGQVLAARKPIAGMGAIALFSDPEGRAGGLWEMAG
ncbi:MAG: VOC family protein [Thermoanaerobaculia bacterium]